jgi:hypothetical protein
VSPRRFLGWEPAQTFIYNQAGQVVRVELEPEWDDDNRQMVLALQAHEAGLCPGCNHPLEETTKPEYKDAYRPETPIRCHYCTTQALVSETAEKQYGHSGAAVPTNDRC